MGRLTLAWRRAEVVAVRDETPTVRTLALSVPEWPGHRAGQHVDVRLTAEDGYQAERSYSIASPPESGLLELTVERLEDGEVSPYLTAELRVGDLLELRGPIGGYFVWDAPMGGPLLLVAGGSGIVPLMAMLRHRAEWAAGVGPGAQGAGEAEAVRGGQAGKALAGGRGDAGDGGPEAGGSRAAGSAVRPPVPTQRDGTAAGTEPSAGEGLSTIGAVPTLLLYSCRTPDEIIYREEIDRLAASDLQLRVWYTLTRRQPPGWTGFRRRVDLEMLRAVAFPPDEAPVAYVCGPTGFVEAVAAGLQTLGYAAERIRTERFGPSGRG